MKIKVSQLKYGERLFNIKQSPRLNLTDGDLAHINYYDNEIVIDANQSDEQKTLSLLHEHFEAVGRVFGQKKLLEEDCDMLAEGTYQLLKQLGIEFDWGEP